MTFTQLSRRESPLWQIIETLQRQGSATIKELEDVLGVDTQGLATARRRLKRRLQNGFPKGLES